MPASFDRCVSAGGKVRTKSLSNNKYIHICYIGGKSYNGYVKTKKTKNTNKTKKAKKTNKKIK